MVSPALRAGVALGAVLVTGSMTVAAVTPSAPITVPESGVFSSVGSDSVRTNWDELLRLYLRWLLERLGGDPNVIVPMNPPVECMNHVEDYYEKYGMASGLSPQEQSDCRQMIIDTWVHLQDAPSNMNPAEISEFAGALSSMFTDVGGDPDTLP